MRTSRGSSLVALAGLLLLTAACGGGAKFALGPPLDVESAPIAVPDDLRPALGISVPEGFVAYEFASGLELPSVIDFDPQGRMFVAELRGRVSIIEDSDGDGLADEPRTFWSDRDERYVSGIDIAPDGTVLISLKGRVKALRDTDSDGRADEAHTVIDGLPIGMHWNNGVALGPDGMLYVANGSICNLCPEGGERSAAILRAQPDGSGLEVYAGGLRNAFDFVFTPEGELWATDNAIDFPREPEHPDYETLLDAPDELNLVVEGGHYGWPECVGSGVGIIADGCEGKMSPVVEFDPYSSSDGIAYYEGEDFPAEYAGDLFVAQFGSNLDSPRQTGRALVRVELTRTTEGYRGEQTLFASGFEQPLDVIVDSLGTLFVTDLAAGKIYRIVWAGE
jgi:glucose/arabinose dehydrogenase